MGQSQHRANKNDLLYYDFKKQAWDSSYYETGKGFIWFIAT